MFGPWRDNPLRLLCTWARWLRLKHTTVYVVNIYVPSFVLLISLPLTLVLTDINFTKEFGIVHQINSLLQILAPSFVAALALVASFPGDALDRQMGGVAPHFNTADGPYSPRRREVLGHLFAYQAGLGTFVYLIGGCIMAASNPNLVSILVKLNEGGYEWILQLLAVIYISVVSHLFAVTLLGLHFLGNFLSGSRLSRGQPTSPSDRTPPVPTTSGQVSRTRLDRPSASRRTTSV